MDSMQWASLPTTLTTIRFLTLSLSTTPADFAQAAVRREALSKEGGD